MRIARLLAGIFCAAFVDEVHSALRLSRHGAPPEDDPTLDEIDKELDDAGKAIEKSSKKAFRHAQQGPASHGDPKKPMMDNVEVMRTMICWGRPKLLDHKDCMQWMVKNCKAETSGEGYCRKLRKYVKSKCRHGDQRGCVYAKKMHVKLAKNDEQDAEKLDVDFDDQDGDGVKDKDDAFPDNPLESKDSDADGIGDSSDKWPEDPSRAHAGEKAAAPAPAMAAAPAAPTGLSMDENVPLPSQGYNEHSEKFVAHDDQKTMTGDWRAEWPMAGGNEHTSVEDICAENPRHAWCKLKLSAAARRAYARSHH